MIDEELINAINLFVKGEEQGFNIFYQKTYDYVYGRARLIMKNDEDAMELLQEVYIVAYKSIDTLNNAGAIYKWLGSITYNQGMKIFRKKKDVLLDEEGQGLFDVQETMDVSVKPEDSVDLKETARIIMAVIDELPEVQRAVVTAYYYDEMSVTDIANLMEVSTGTIKSRLNYARKSMKTAIEEKEKESGIKLHSTSIPAIIIAVRMLQEGYSFNGADACYTSICETLKLTGEVASSQIVRESQAIADTTKVIGKTVARGSVQKWIIGAFITLTITGIAIFGGLKVKQLKQSATTESYSSEQSVQEDEAEDMTEVTVDTEAEEATAKEVVEADEFIKAKIRARYADVIYDLSMGFKPAEMSDEELSFCTPLENAQDLKYQMEDMNGDGIEDVAVTYTGGSMAEMFTRIYTYDLEKQDIVLLHSGGAGTTDIYDNGVLTVAASHNGTDDMSFWPYEIYRYSEEAGMYEHVGNAYKSEGKYFFTDTEEYTSSGGTEEEYNKFVDNLYGNANKFTYDGNAALYWDRVEIAQIKNEYFMQMAERMKNMPAIGKNDIGVYCLENGYDSFFSYIMPYMEEHFNIKFDDDMIEPNGYLADEKVVVYSTYEMGSLWIENAFAGVSVFGVTLGMSAEEANKMLQDCGLYKSRREDSEYCTGDDFGFYVSYTEENGIVTKISIAVKAAYGG